MRIIAMLAASAHLCLAACQTPPTADSSLAGAGDPQQQAYVRPGVKTADAEPAGKHQAEPAGKQEAEATAKVQQGTDLVTKVRVGDPAMRVPTPAPATSPKVREVPDAKPPKARVAPQPAPQVREAMPVAPKVREARDSTIVCHPRRRVVGEERPTRDDAQRAAENAWMGNVRYDYGERYQDINRAKDVRNICGPSSASAVLKVQHFRCAVEATPCRAVDGEPVEPDEQRYEPKPDPKIEMSSRK